MSLVVALVADSYARRSLDEVLDFLRACLAKWEAPDDVASPAKAAD
jgi:hypothetical protein